jgi:hypothetical protein
MRKFGLLIFAFLFSQANIFAGTKNERSTYALIVGISNYQYLPPLKYADKDALLFKEFINSQNNNDGSENIFMLLNDEAKDASLTVKATKWLETRDYKKGDRLYIYLSGYIDAIAAEETLFLGADFKFEKADQVSGASLSITRLKELAKQIMSKGAEVIFVLDGSRGNIPGSEGGERLYANSTLQGAKGEVFLLAATPGQSAIEGQSIGGGHGLFCWYLVGGLAGGADADKDNKVTYTELLRYLTTNVDADSKLKFNTQQLPVFCCIINNNDVLSISDKAFYKKWMSLRESSTGSSIKGNGPDR